LQFTADIARAIHAALMQAGRPTLIVVGNVPPAALQEAAARALGDWDGPGDRPVITRNLEPRRHVIVVPRSGLAQTAIVLGRAVPAGEGSDDLALELAGATAASALREVLRRDRGDTYRVEVTHAPACSGGLVWIETQVDAVATGAALRSLFAALRSLQGRFITGETLRLLGRAFQIERMLAQQSCVERVLAVARQHLLGRPDEALASELRALGSLPGGAVERALRSAFEPENLQIVLVGDPTVIAAQVAPLGLGPLRVVTDGRW
jgi:zinc protease